MVVRIKNLLRDRLIKEKFNPGFVGLFVNPFYIARRGLVEGVKKYRGFIGGRVLDVGCGTKPYRDYLECSDYIGLEIDSEFNRKRNYADFYYEGLVFPFPDENFDTCITNQVLEHVFNPDIFLSEVRRVLRKNGILFLTVPFVWDEHEQPFDYARYSSFGLKHILKTNGFEVIETTKSVNNLSALFQLLNLYFFKSFPVRSKFLSLIVQLFVHAPITVFGIFLAGFFPKNNDFFLDNIVVARRT